MPPLAAERRFVCVGAMGAGKTMVLAMAAICRALRNPGYNIGVVAPTQKRLRIVWQKIVALLPPAWIRQVRLNDGEIILVNGARLQFVATKIYSADIGSPIQGQSWIACYVDEEQDITDSVMADIAMRGRDAPNGIYPVLSTCTLKDTPDWRNRKALYERRGDVTIYRMEALANPFVAKEYWEQLKLELTPRQYRMRVLALDAKPERAVYVDFDRDTHLRPIPDVGARDVTARITNGFAMLIGYDPGRQQDVSLFLKAYDVRGEPGPVWFVVDEITTLATTTEVHATDVLRRLQEKYRLQYPDDGQAIIRADPYGNSEERPHVTVYKEFAKLGLKIKPAAYNKLNTGPGMIPKEARIGVVNSLLRNAAGETRLYIATDDTGKSVAPKLVAALEMSERDETGKAETAKKTTADLSHWPAALGYALWPYERIRLSHLGVRKA